MMLPFARNVVTDFGSVVVLGELEFTLGFVFQIIFRYKITVPYRLRQTLTAPTSSLRMINNFCVIVRESVNYLKLTSGGVVLNLDIEIRRNRQMLIRTTTNKTYAGCIPEIGKI